MTDWFRQLHHHQYMYNYLQISHMYTDDGVNVESGPRQLYSHLYTRK